MLGLWKQTINSIGPVFINKLMGILNKFIASKYNEISRFSDNEMSWKF